MTDIRSVHSIPNRLLGGPVAGQHAGPVTGSIAGLVTGPIAGPVSGPIAGPITGPMAGPVTGPMAGSHKRRVSSVLGSNVKMFSFIYVV